MKHRFAWGVPGLVVVVAIAAGCTSATSARSRPSAVLATSACGNVSTNDFSAATVLFRADPDAMLCLAHAMTTCRPTSLDIWQIAVDSGENYRLTITGSAANGCTARLGHSTFVAGITSPNPTPITVECTARMQDTDVLITCPDRTYLLPPRLDSAPSILPNSSPVRQHAAATAVVRHLLAAAW
jgi:hypothetical protein